MIDTLKALAADYRKKADAIHDKSLTDFACAQELRQCAADLNKVIAQAEKARRCDHRTNECNIEGCECDHATWAQAKPAAVPEARCTHQVGCVCFAPRRSFLPLEEPNNG